MTKMLAGKNVIVTGGASGIGRGIALAAAKHGANSVIVGDLTDQPREGGVPTVELLEQMGVLVKFCRTDVSVEADVEDLVACADEFGGVDLMVCNAGISLPGDDGFVSGENFRKLIDVNLIGVMLSAQCGARQMQRLGKKGSIVAISSMGGLKGSQMTVGYSTTKGGVNLMVASMADAWGPDGIRINAVCPGMIQTALAETSPEIQAAMEGMRQKMPLRRIAAPEEVGDVVSWLGSDYSSFVTGAFIPVDGGQTAVL